MAAATQIRLSGGDVRRGLHRTSLIALGRRHLVRARNSRLGASLEALHDDAAESTIWLVAMTAGRVLSELPTGDGTALQVLQGQVQVVRLGRSVTAFPGDLVAGVLRRMEVISFTDCVVLVMGSTGSRPPEAAS